MATDVRVRLSAEGVEDVVDALRRISTEAKKTGHEAGGAFHELKDELKDIGKDLVGFLAIGAIVEKTRELFAEVIKGADALGDLHQQTGLSIDALQAIGAAAKQNGSNLEVATGAVQVFTKTMGDAELGSKKAQQGFHALGLSIEGMKKKTPDEQFKAVIQKLAEIDDEGRRAAIGAKIFGDQYGELAVAFKHLADDGVGHFIEKLKEMGVYLDETTVAQMKHAKDQVREMGEQVEGLATQFLTGLMPAASEALESFVKDTSGAGGGMQKLGQLVGVVVASIVGFFQILGTAIGARVGEIVEDVRSMGDAFEALKSRDWAGIKAAVGSVFDHHAFANEQITGKAKEVADRVNDAYDVLAGNLKPEGKLPDAGNKGRGAGGSPFGDLNAAGKIAKARLELIKAQLAAELRLYEAQSKLREDQERQAYEEGRLSLSKYYDDRAEIANGKFDRELAILRKQREATAKLPAEGGEEGALRRKAQLAQLDGEIAAKEIDRQDTLAQLAQQRRAAEKQLAEDKLQIDAKVAQIEGNTARAARDALDIELVKMEEMLRKVGTADADIKRILAEARSQGEAKIGADEAKRRADAEMRAMTAQIAVIQNQVGSGQLFPVQGEQQIIAIQKEHLDGLRKLADQYLALARAAGPGNEQMVAEAEQFRQSIEGISIATNEAALQMANLKATAQDALESGISDFLMNVSNRTMSVSQAFRNMIASIVADLARAEAQFLAKQFVKWLLGSAGGEGQQGGGKGGFFSGLISAIGGLFGKGGGGGVAGAAAQGANTAALTANTASLTAAAAAQTGALTAMVANTAALVANTAAVGAAATSNAVSSAFAGGGQVNGPGTSTSDSIPAWLSDGEFVVNASAVRKPGMLAMLHAINGTPGPSRGGALHVRKYAEGGIVGGGSTVQTYAVDASNIPQHIIYQAVREQVLRVIAGNPASVRQSIGG